MYVRVKDQSLKAKCKFSVSINRFQRKSAGCALFYSVSKKPMNVREIMETAGTISFRQHFDDNSRLIENVRGKKFYRIILFF